MGIVLPPPEIRRFTPFPFPSPAIEERQSCFLFFSGLTANQDVGVSLFPLLRFRLPNFPFLWAFFPRWFFFSPLEAQNVFGPLLQLADDQRWVFFSRGRKLSCSLFFFLERRPTLVFFLESRGKAPCPPLFFSPVHPSSSTCCFFLTWEPGVALFSQGGNPFSFFDF